MFSRVVGVSYLNASFLGFLMLTKYLHSALWNSGVFASLRFRYSYLRVFAELARKNQTTESLSVAKILRSLHIEEHRRLHGGSLSCYDVRRISYRIVDLTSLEATLFDYEDTYTLHHHVSPRPRCLYNKLRAFA